MGFAQLVDVGVFFVGLAGVRVFFLVFFPFEGRLPTSFGSIFWGEGTSQRHVPAGGVPEAGRAPHHAPHASDAGDELGRCHPRRADDAEPHRAPPGWGWKP